MADQYIGPLKVLTVEHENEDIVKIRYENGNVDRFTKKSFDLIVTDVQKDWNYVQDKRFGALVDEVVSIVLSYDLVGYEIDKFLAQVGADLSGRVNRALSYLWYQSDGKYIPGSDPADFFSVSKAEEIIRGIPKDDSGKGKK